MNEFIMDKLSVNGKNIIVTGGAQGIGKCAAETLAQCGANVGILDVNIGLADAVAAEINAQSGGKAVANSGGKAAANSGGKTAAYSCDVTDSSMVTQAFAAFTSDFGALDAVFNNAGIVTHNGAEDVGDDEWKKVIDVNLNGVFYVAREAARCFIGAGKGGSIVNMASMSGVIVNIPQQQASYNASKAAVIQLTKSLAVEWADKGIRVNCLSPGYIATEMTGKLRGDWKSFWESLIPFKRMGRPDELVGALVYLMSDASSYTSGLNMVIDGGFTCV